MASPSNIPEIQLDPESAPAVRDWLEAKQIRDDANARIVDAEQRLMDVGEQLRRQLSQNRGKLFTSIRLRANLLDNNAAWSGSVRMTQPQRWLKMKTDEAVDILRAAFLNKFDTYFTIHTTLHIDADNLTPKQISEITKILGRKAKQALTVSSEITPTDEFMTDAILDKQTAKQWSQMVADEGLCRLIKPSFAI